MPKVIYTLIIALLLNSFAWAANGELWENTGSSHLDHAELVSTLAAEMNSDIEGEHPDESSDSCNHGCHMQNHFWGQIAQSFALTTQSPCSFNVAIFSVTPLHSPENQFRPPQPLA